MRPRRTDVTRSREERLVLAELARERAEPDHAEEDQADDQHSGDDVTAFLGGVGEEREHGSSLTETPAMKREGARERIGSDQLADETGQLGRIARLSQGSAPEQRCRRGQIGRAHV